MKKTILPLLIIVMLVSSCFDWDLHFEDPSPEPQVIPEYLQCTVRMPSAGLISEMIPEDQKDIITHLTVSGDINGIDVKYIRRMGRLITLDLSDAHIVAGGHLL